jgi:hypothetical protein
MCVRVQTYTLKEGYKLNWKRETPLDYYPMNALKIPNTAKV